MFSHHKCYIDSLKKGRNMEPWHFMFEKERSPFSWYLNIHAPATKQQPLCTRGAVFKTTQVCILEKDHKLILRKIQEILNRNSLYTDETIIHADKQIPRLLEEFMRLEFLDYNTMAASQLKKMLQKYTQIIMDWCSETLWVANFFDEILTEELIHAIQHHLKSLKRENRFAEYFTIFTTPSGQTLLQQAQEELIRIAAAPKKEQEALLKKHALIYGWIGDYARYNHFTTYEVFKKQLDEIKNPAKTLQEREQEKKKMENRIKIAMTKLKAESLFPLITTARKAVYFRNQRMDVLNVMLYRLRHLLEEIAARYKQTLQEIVFLTPPEIYTLLEGNMAVLRKRAERKKGYVVWFDGKETVVLSGAEAADKNKLLKEERLAEVKELRGMPTQGGRVQGIVRIVRTQEDAKGFKQGDILVTPMTTPALIPLMKKAAAIVTDEGGITCHAAIISRELKIPCIVGTAKATKIFKDGDLVEVNANHASIRLIR